GEKNNLLFADYLFNLTGIEQHDASADSGKIVFNLIVIKGVLLRKNSFKEFSEFWDIPLLVTQVIDKLSHGLFGLDLEKIIEGTAGGDHH
ncbi:MAG: hypothetical protein PF439_11055, partial [Helicobacteraceae bacterium]|nr:hypothetical protein [Helicobacteraceae bacterium]